MTETDTAKTVYNENSQPKPEKRSLCLLAALSLVFNFALFSPVDFYLNNIVDIGLTYMIVMYACLPVAAVLFIAVFLTLRLTRRKAHIIALAVTTGLNLALYVQGNFMTQGMQTLDGESYYVHPVRAILDLLLWAVLLALPFLIYKKKQESFRFFILLISGAVLAVEIAALLFTTVQIMTGKKAGLFNFTPDTYIYSCDLENEFTYSTEKNLIVIIPDEYDSYAFDYASAVSPETVSSFDGFTYYNNTIGMYQYTKQGVCNIFTGSLCGDENKRSEVFEKGCFFDSIPEEYNVEFYSDKDFLPDDVKKKYSDNYIESELTAGDLFCIGSVFYDLTLYRTLPDIAKRPFWMYSGDLSSKLSAGKTYLADNLSFYNSLPKKLELTDKPCVKVIYIQGLHSPRTINSELERVAENVEPQEAAIAVNKVLSKYFDLLKSSGVYDNSDIILLADHGHRPNYGARYPLLMIKRAGDTEKGIRTSSAPISYADICPTLRSLVGDESYEGSTVFDIPEGIKRERYFAALDETTTEDVDRTKPIIIQDSLVENKEITIPDK